MIEPPDPQTQIQRRDTPVEAALALIAWLFSILIITSIMLPLLSGEMIGSWDLTPQYHLLDLMEGYLLQGRLSGYDPEWFAGFPAFTFYAPLSYIAIAIFHWCFLNPIAFMINGGSIPSFAALNIAIFCLPFIFLIALSAATRKIYGPGKSVYAILTGLIFLTAPGSPHLAPISLYSSLLHGHLAAFCGTILFVLILGSLERHKRSRSLSSLLLCSLLITALILTHTITTLFFACVFAVFIVCNLRHTKDALIITAISVSLSSFWWLPFIKNLWLTSGTAIGISIQDPLLTLLPNISRLTRCLFYPSLDSLAALPVPALVLATGIVVASISHTRRGRIFLPLTFLAILVLIPRNLLIHIIPIPAHYYRFIMPLFALMALLAAEGLAIIAERMRAIKVQPLRLTGTVVFGAVLASTAVSTSIQNYPINAPVPDLFHHLRFRAEAGCGGTTLPASPLPLPAYPAQPAAKKILRFISANPPLGRLAVESTEKDSIRLGSPHFFTSRIPDALHLPIVPGLLAESSASANFIIPTLAYRSESLLWAQATLYYIDPQNNPLGNPIFSIDDMLIRLAAYNVQYILAASDAYRNNLHSASRDLLHEIFSSPPYTLFELKKFWPRIEGKIRTPFLFVDAGGLSFRDFTEEWFKRNDLLQRRVVFSKQRYDDLPEEDRDRFPGIIVSRHPSDALSAEEHDSWLRTGKRIIYLNTTAPEHSLPTPEALFIPRFFRNYTAHPHPALFRIAAAMEEIAPYKDSYEQIIPLVDKPHRLVFRSHFSNVYINYSYFPYWKSTDPQQVVYMASPSHMFVFNRGRCELTY